MDRSVVMGGWQPIETAPKDGSEFVAYYPVGDGTSGFVEMVKYIKPPRGVEPFTLGGIEPTHWIAPPAEKETLGFRFVVDDSIPDDTIAFKHSDGRTDYVKIERKEPHDGE
jgi:hypothetical protein